MPTSAELQQLFADSTRSPTAYPDSGYISNTEMCSVHGWPLNGQCGGSSHNYWSSTPNSAGNHRDVGLGDGNAGSANDSVTYQVACIR
ncbi:MAG: hypothetical protein WA173_17955 [Pseudomonas sp.]|uniref:hypothetical protein n=1 Tax=Pseudomonas sp. TaxID=306 RepID=UPI003BB6DDD0